MVESKSHGELKRHQIFSPFRAVGFVSNHVPLDLTVKGTDQFALTSVGKSFHLYNVVSTAVSSVSHYVVIVLPPTSTYVFLLF